MIEVNETREHSDRSTCRAMAPWTLIIGYVFSPYAIWGCFAKLGWVNCTIDPMSGALYAPLRLLSDHLDFIDDFYRWQCDLFWP